MGQIGLRVRYLWDAMSVIYGTPFMLYVIACVGASLYNAVGHCNAVAKIIRKT